LSDAEILKILHSQGYPKTMTPGYGQNAVRNDREFMTKIRQVRRDGYGLNLEEGEPGINAIAVAVRGDLAPESPVVATIAVAGPSLRVTKRSLLAAVPSLQRAAREMTEVWPMRRQLNADGAGLDTRAIRQPTMSVAATTMVKK
jgi:DNA-binding IclR family transcriptional regulator